MKDQIKLLMPIDSTESKLKELKFQLEKELRSYSDKLSHCETLVNKHSFAMSKIDEFHPLMKSLTDEFNNRVSAQRTSIEEHFEVLKNQIDITNRNIKQVELDTRLELRNFETIIEGFHE